MTDQPDLVERLRLAQRSEEVQREFNPNYRVQSIYRQAADRITELEAERDGVGWLYVGDDGIEWSASHPIESGEMPDARLIRCATSAELLSALKDAWEAGNEAVQSEDNYSRRWREAEARAQAAESRLALAEKVVEAGKVIQRAVQNEDDPRFRDNQSIWESTLANSLDFGHFRALSAALAAYEEGGGASNASLRLPSNGQAGAEPSAAGEA